MDNLDPKEFDPYRTNTEVQAHAEQLIEQIRKTVKQIDLGYR